MLTMPFIPGVVRLGFTWSDGVADFGSRIFLKGAWTALTAADLHAAAADLSGTWGTHLAPETAPTYHLVKLDLLSLSSDTAPYGYWTGSIAGTNAGQELPSNVSVDIEFNTDLRYRGGRPLIHHPPGTADQLESGRQFSDAAVAGWTAAFTAFAAGITAVDEGAFTGAAHVWLHGYKSGATVDEVTIKAIAGYQCRQYVGTMRRRARKLR